MVTPRSGRSWLGCWVVLVLCTVWLAGQARGQGTALGGIRGEVRDLDVDAPLNGAQVVLTEANLSTTTVEGRFVFESVPPGTYTLSVFKDGYTRKIAPDVVVAAGAFAEVRIALSPEIVDLEEFTVRGLELSAGTEAGLLDIRQEAPALSDAISADLIKKAGSSTAANALRLVVGTSVQEGKYVVIRGLSDRYTVTQLNDVRLPTADADKRAVQLDQFPGAVIESITVNKTFTPDQQGDATGGSVNIKTKSVPEKFFFTTSGAVEYNTQASFQEDFISYKGGGVSPFAIDAGGRALSPGVRGETVPDYAEAAPEDPALAAQRLPNAQWIDAITRSFTPVIGTSRKEIGPNYSTSLAVGDRQRLAEDIQLGWLASYSYRQKYSFYDDGQRNVVVGTAKNQPLNTQYGFAETRGVDEVLWGATASVGLQLGLDHKLDLGFVFNQTGTDDARLLEDPNAHRREQALKYQERSTLSLQLSGDHKFASLGDLGMDWRLASNEATQDEPDFRAFGENTETHQAYFGSIYNNPRRVFRSIDEESHQAALNFDIPFTQWSGLQAHVKAGPFFDLTTRDLQQDTFLYLFATSLGTDPVSERNNALQYNGGPGFFTDIFLEPHRIGLATNNPPAANQLLWYITNPTQVDADYKGDQKLLAGYGMVELPLTSWLKVIAGVRVESTELSINVTGDDGLVTILRRDAGGGGVLEEVPEDEAGADLQELDFLPAVTLVWEVIPKLDLRLSYSQTIARPTFRELAPLRTYDFIGGDVFIGNSELTMSHIDNYDVRVEWFRRPGDVVAASVFYKEIEDPIEQVTFDSTGGEERFVQRVNYPSGKLYGAEGEIRQRLDAVHELLKDLTIGFNASYIVSEVKLPDEERQRFHDNVGINVKDRPLFGQPNYLLNANLVYDNPRTGTAVGLFYTRTGDVLVSGGASTGGGFVPDLYELESDNLDLSVEQRIGRNWRVIFRAKNLTDPTIRRAYRVSWLDKDTLQSKYTRGIDFSLGASYTW